MVAWKDITGDSNLALIAKTLHVNSSTAQIPAFDAPPSTRSRAREEYWVTCAAASANCGRSLNVI